jgi:hypothetical protein
MKDIGRNAPLEIFFSYAHEDEALMDDVRRQLIVYERNGRILKWHDRKISAGTDWRSEIDSRLESARIILLFMSPHFIESKYCYEVEGQAALRKHNANEARAVPIVLRPCPWEETPFGKMQALPKGVKPVSVWPDRDEACLSVAKGVMNLVDEIDRSQECPTNLRVPDNATARDENCAYCARCGERAGKQSICTGPYTHHQFQLGSLNDYCKRCGVLAGSQSICTGAYTHHAFASRNPKNRVFCSRCGIPPGRQTICTGAQTHHDFIQT